MPLTVETFPEPLGDTSPETVANFSRITMDWVGTGFTGDELFLAARANISTDIETNHRIQVFMESNNLLAARHIEEGDFGTAVQDLRRSYDTANMLFSDETLLIMRVNILWGLAHVYSLWQSHLLLSEENRMLHRTTAMNAILCIVAGDRLIGGRTTDATEAVYELTNSDDLKELHRRIASVRIEHPQYRIE